ncbi:hypothetical protein JQ607_33055 [Bradyrhizobium liaoningense]|uniref:hypothetical protein n=1 Tax=Bradyrhizobium liaoningense TaxID=43992 RepID=UPI001BA4FBF9|nr:hypothetical protein [Bradyrhizobium liaoningense]MBR0845052.1 hypothetical protein [Bradyrhizobium liaoningense]
MQCVESRLLLIALLALVAPASAAIETTANTMVATRVAGELDRWQRIDFSPSSRLRYDAAQIKIIIRTKGPSMQGLIRIPGAPASNFDTGHTLTAIDLINIRNAGGGYAEITSLEILFTQTTRGQFYEVLEVQ